MTPLRPQTKAEQRVETTRRLLEAAREEFAQRGYALASTEAICQQAGVTRGALYHYFGSKQGLFQAVVAEIQREVGQRVAEASQAASGPWEELIQGCQAFLRASIDPDVQRILLIDGPANLGWEEWRRMDAENAMRLLEEGLQALVEMGIIRAASVQAVTHLLSGAMNEAVLWIARSETPHQALDATSADLEQLLNGLRVR